jgi:choline kinase
VSRTGVVLAAGFGSRLREHDPAAVKPLTQVAGKPLLVGAIDGLLEAGCTHVVVVLGYRADAIAAEVAAARGSVDDVTFVPNPEFALANGVSVLAAAPHTPGTFVLTMADHVFDATCYRVARETEPPEGGAVLLVDRRVDEVFDLDDATKVAVEGDQIVAIGKTLTAYNAIDTGLFVCTGGLFDALRHTRAARGDASLSEGIAALAERGLMRVRDIEGGDWQDVDTPEMLAEARRRFGA